jgi:hypothetical protein
MKKEIRYRVEAVWFEATQLSLRQYEVIRKTPKGLWICDGGVERFVLNEGRKRFAVETRDEALKDFKARKWAQVRILKANLERAESELREAVDHGIYHVVNVGTGQLSRS